MQEIIFALMKKRFIFIVSIGEVYFYALYEMQKMPLAGPDGLRREIQCEMAAQARLVAPRRICYEEVLVSVHVGDVAVMRRLACDGAGGGNACAAGREGCCES